jgi:hypothetical protein
MSILILFQILDHTYKYIENQDSLTHLLHNWARLEVSLKVYTVAAPHLSCPNTHDFSVLG